MEFNSKMNYNIDLNNFKTLSDLEGFSISAKLYCFFLWHSSCEIIINIQPD